MSHAVDYLKEVVHICHNLPVDDIENLVHELADLEGRLFIIGLGGSAANASHMANDLRKLCGIEAYCMSDNVSELTARANDEGWATIFANAFWKPADALFVLSVGGGTSEVSLPITHAIEAALTCGMKVFGIVGRDGGYTRKYGNCVVVVPVVEPVRVTPHTEAFQAVIWHLLVSHPKLQKKATKW